MITLVVHPPFDYTVLFMEILNIKRKNLTHNINVMQNIREQVLNEVGSNVDGICYDGSNRLIIPALFTC